MLATQQEVLYALPCIIKTHYQVDTIILILQLRKEALPKTTQLGSGRVESEFRLQVHLALLYCIHKRQSVDVCSRMVSALAVWFWRRQGC